MFTDKVIYQRSNVSVLVRTWRYGTYGTYSYTDTVGRRRPRLDSSPVSAWRGTV